MPRATASILHLDLDAFFAAVEQRDKPSLRGKPVIVGGTGGRGVVATCSYEARTFGVRSAMSTAEARKRVPGSAAFLGSRFPAYKQSSEIVMGLLRDVSPLVEPVSMDEAFVDLAAAENPDLSVAGVTRTAQALRERIRRATGGLTASVGVGTSKIVAKVGSDACKPNGLLVVPPGEELALLHPLPVRALWGVGPATAEKLTRIGVSTVADLYRLEEVELVGMFGQAHGRGLYALARAADDRTVQADREAKSVSAEDTFDVDIVDATRISREVDLLSARVAKRLEASKTAGRTVTVKVRRHDFTTFTRSVTLPQPTSALRTIAQVAKRTVAQVPVEGGFRLLGVGVSGLTDHVQEDLFAEQEAADALPDRMVEPVAAEVLAVAAASTWSAGADVAHDEFGAGWVWGSGHGRVTVRFEGPLTGPGPVKTFASDDPALRAAAPPAVVPLQDVTPQECS